VKDNAVQATVVPPKVSVSPKASSSPSSSGSVPVSADISADISTEASVPASNASGEIRLIAYTTSYTYWDNTPPGSSDISNPVIHDKAGGTGTYQDPITIAVGHVMSGGKDTLDFPAGTKFYIPNVRKYFIVEDTCGDGNTPQNGPCHSLKTADKGAQVWLDMWIGGNSVTSSVADKCANILTANHLVIQNPASSYAVVAGPVIGASCAAQFGDVLVSA
jgi:hypothetical protein